MPADPFGPELALELARCARALHWPETDGTCRHCPPGTRWPCSHFEGAQRVVRVLTAIEAQAEPAGFLRGDEYIQSAIADMHAAARPGRPHDDGAPPWP
ncbi:MAG TPA: hypothetical protein VGJ44_19360 [Kribbellaceae bacterium]|jgi:hypothetical protein